MLLHGPSTLWQNCSNYEQIMGAKSGQAFSHENYLIMFFPLITVFPPHYIFRCYVINSQSYAMNYEEVYMS